MKYSGSDFKMTSQANHLAKLLSLLTEVQHQSIHLQRLYKRRKIDENGNISSNWSVFGTSNVSYDNINKEEPDIDSNYVYLMALRSWGEN